MSFLAELWQFMRVRKKYWLLPIVLMMALFGGLVVLTQGSAGAADADPWPVGVLPRQRGGVARGRRADRRRPGRAVHAQEARFGVPQERGRVLPEGRRHRARPSRPRRVLRQAVLEVRAPARDLSGIRAQGLHLVPHGGPGV